ncbi:uncharacterized protein PAM68-like [Carica papaya]|uniref:uncharacterized protein PAM68-like n=1 Tax=Carica papaya TaxID=3649 RepID=UPI000B8CCB1F|nr:uncharacterized protein PAM68-like [Carica papaya]XP_021892069.1 uncharacterized protein PAM68-like [Carica papaya]
MKTLICSKQSPQLLPLPKPYPRNPPLQHKISQTLIQPTPTWKLHAQTNAKGFSSSSSKSLRAKTRNPNNNNGKESGEEDEPLPQVVFNRMIVRILVSVGAPLAIGIGLLNLLGLIKDQNLWDVPMWLPFLTTLLTFGASALGIAYGSLSASWDPEKKGSVLGLEEAQHNWAEMWSEENDS